MLTSALVNPAKDKSLCIGQTHVMDISHVVWVLPKLTFQEFQNLNSGLSSCLSGRVNRAQQASSQLSLLFIYPEGTVLMQQLHPVLLNPSAMASTVDPQTLVSCWGVQDTVWQVKFCAGFPIVITTVDFWDLKNAQRGTYSLCFLSLCVHKGLVYFESDTNTACTESDDKHGWVTWNAAWRDQFLSVGRPLLEAGSRERKKVVVCVGWCWLFGLCFQCPIICKAACSLSVADLITF